MPLQIAKAAAVLHFSINAQHLAEWDREFKENNEFALVQTLVNLLQKTAFSASTTKDYQDSSHSLTCDLDITTCGIFLYKAPFVRDRAHSRKWLTFTVVCMWMQYIGNFLFCGLLLLIDIKLDSLLLEQWRFLMRNPFSCPWHQEEKDRVSRKSYSPISDSTEGSYPCFSWPDRSANQMSYSNCTLTVTQSHNSNCTSF